MGYRTTRFLPRSATHPLPTTVSLAVACCLVITGLTFAGPPANSTTLEALAANAVSSNSLEAAAAIDALRDRGPAGLEALLTRFSAELDKRISGEAGSMDDASWQRLRLAIDKVSRQRDGYASGLYWYADLDLARAAAKASGKPILFLRLLGRLDEDMSCANSRFFRTTLYSNAEVSAYLRDHFVLLWKTVRPVPKVTIDFGDGRKIERTLTGNSVHYVLDSNGRPVYALPGLYGAAAFLRELNHAEEAVKACAAAGTEDERLRLLRQYHRERLDQLASDWASDLSKARVATPPSRTSSGEVARSTPPTAEAASLAAVTKSLVERRVLRGMSSDPRLPGGSPDDKAWGAIAKLFEHDAHLDQHSRALIVGKSSLLTNQAVPSEADRKARFERMLARLEQVIAEDTARNIFVLQTRIHEWFAEGTVTSDVERLNEKVYAELFLTPGWDPWLGLVSDDDYTALENDGVVR
jgi:hypothetical protein